MKFGSVCSGIGAPEQAWIKPLGWRCAFMSEIEAFPRAVLKFHHPEVPLHGDFTTIQADDYGPIDLLVGGTPCQSFSVAGLRGGLGDARGNLALEYLRLVDRKRPRWVVWENVPGVFSSLSHDAPDPRPPDIDLDGDNGPRDGEEVVVTDEYDADESHAFACFLAGLSELGYGIAYRVFDAQFTRTRLFPRAVPQRRRRVFVVGYLGDWRPPAAVLFERESLLGHPPPRREAGEGFTADAAPSLTGSGRGVPRPGETRGQDPVVAIQAGATRENPASGPDGMGVREGVAFTLEARAEVQAVAHSLRAEGFDASEDGTGRGTPLGPAAFGGNDTRGPIEVATAVNAHAGPHGRIDFESETFVVAGSMPAAGGTDQKLGHGWGQQEFESGYIVPVAHAFDARQNEVVQYGPISGPLDTDGHSVAVAFALRGREDGAVPEVDGDGHAAGALRAASGGSTRDYVAFSSKDHGQDAEAGVSPTLRAAGHDGSHANAGAPPAVAFTTSALSNSAGWESEVNPALNAQVPNDTNGIQYGIRDASGVRRLTPNECARLQAFPDHFTMIPWRGQNAPPDGPMYKAYGNSMACNVLGYIGERIQLVEGLINGED